MIEDNYLLLVVHYVWNLTINILNYATCRRTKSPSPQNDESCEPSQKFLPRQGTSCCRQLRKIFFRLLTPFHTQSLDDNDDGRALFCFKNPLQAEQSHSTVAAAQAQRVQESSQQYLRHVDDSYQYCPS